MRRWVGARGSHYSRGLFRRILIYPSRGITLNSVIIFPLWRTYATTFRHQADFLAQKYAKQMVESVAETGNPMVITQNGEAKAVVMNVREYDQMQQSLALLRMLADSSADVEAGNLRDSDEVFADIRNMIAEKRNERG